MIAGVHYNNNIKQFTFQTKMLLDVLRFNKIDTKYLYAGDSAFWSQVRDCDLVIFQFSHHDYERQIARSILPVIETQLNIRCFPNLVSSWLYDDKVREYYWLKAMEFPIIDSWIFYDEDSAMDFAEKSIYPIVFKLRSGAGSQMVTLLTNKSQAKKYIRVMFQKGARYNRIMPGTLFKTIKSDGLNHFLRKRLGKFKNKINSGTFHFQRDWSIHRNYVLFQKFLPDNQYDTRVVVIGDNAFAFQRFNRPDDFRASGSSTYCLDPAKIDLEFVKIAMEISRKSGFDSMAYDFLYDENKKPAIAEISYTFGSNQGTKVDQCPGYWDKKLHFCDQQPNIALFTLRYLLNQPNLNYPVGESL